MRDDAGKKKPLGRVGLRGATVELAEKEAAAKLKPSAKAGVRIVSRKGKTVEGVCGSVKDAKAWVKALEVAIAAS